MRPNGMHYLLNTWSTVPRSGGVLFILKVSDGIFPSPRLHTLGMQVTKHVCLFCLFNCMHAI